jgi:hypothetical protein
LKSIIDSTKQNTGEMKQTLLALQILREALSFGIALITLGNEMTIVEHTYEDHWAYVLPAVHRAMWDYFSSVPEVVKKLC